MSSKALDRLLRKLTFGVQGYDYLIPVRNSTSFIYEPTTQTILFHHSREQTTRLCRRFLAYHTGLPVLCITVKKKEFLPGNRFLAYTLRSEDIDYGAYDGFVSYPTVEFIEKDTRTAVDDIISNFRNIKILSHLKSHCDDMAKIDDLKEQMNGYQDIIQLEFSKDRDLQRIIQKDIDYTSGNMFTDPYNQSIRQCLDISEIDRIDENIIQTLRA